MKKFALLFAAAFCLPIIGLTGCGGPAGENTVIQGSTDSADQAEMDAAMEADMEAQMNEAQ